MSSWLHILFKLLDNLHRKYPSNKELLKARGLLVQKCGTFESQWHDVLLFLENKLRQAAEDKSKHDDVANCVSLHLLQVEDKHPMILQFLFDLHEVIIVCTGLLVEALSFKKGNVPTLLMSLVVGATIGATLGLAPIVMAASTSWVAATTIFGAGLGGGTGAAFSGTVTAATVSDLLLTQSADQKALVEARIKIAQDVLKTSDLKPQAVVEKVCPEALNLEWLKMACTWMDELDACITKTAL